VARDEAWGSDTRSDQGGEGGEKCKKKNRGVKIVAPPPPPQNQHHGIQKETLGAEG